MTPHSESAISVTENMAKMIEMLKPFLLPGD
jgi:hypothetical protein